MTALNRIAEILENLSSSDNVPMVAAYYGMCPEKSLDTWNYFVFNRSETKKSSNRRDWQTYYTVNIIHEDYIPEGYVAEVVEALETDDGIVLRCTGDPVRYNYALKGSTNVVVEVASITLFAPEKRGMN